MLNVKTIPNRTVWKIQILVCNHSFYSHTSILHTIPYEYHLCMRISISMYILLLAFYPLELTTDELGKARATSLILTNTLYINSVRFDFKRTLLILFYYWTYDALSRSTQKISFSFIHIHVFGHDSVSKVFYELYSVKRKKTAKEFFLFRIRSVQASGFHFIPFNIQSLFIVTIWNNQNSSWFFLLSAKVEAFHQKKERSVPNQHKISNGMTEFPANRSIYTSTRKKNCQFGIFIHI